MRRLLAIACVFLLLASAHAQNAMTDGAGNAMVDSSGNAMFPAVAMYLQTDLFVVALKTANAYAAEPRCSATGPKPCSQQSVVNQLSTQADKTSVAVRSAQAEPGNMYAMAQANDAIAAFNALIPKQDKP